MANYKPITRKSQPRSGTKESWQNVSRWYTKKVGIEGSYYHRSIVLPGALRLLDLKPLDMVLDLGCGQGILGRRLPKEVSYHGYDIAPELVAQARKFDTNPRHEYSIGDITKPLPTKQNSFTHAAIILALQNVKNGSAAIKNAARSLQPKGKLVIVLNHPCYRIPRQSGWSVDPKNKMQQRWVNRYMSALDVPIDMHPSKQSKKLTWSYHYPLQTYFDWLKRNGMMVSTLEEWVSDKESEGKQAIMENRSRNEIPLFMAILAEKKA